MSAPKLATKPPITKLLNSKRLKKANNLINNNNSDNNGDQRARDAADTLVSLAHSSTTGSGSAQSTPSTSPTADLNNRKLIEFICENSKKQHSDFGVTYKTPTHASNVLEQFLKTCSTSIQAKSMANDLTMAMATNENLNSKRANSMSSSSSTRSVQSTDLDDMSQSSFNSSSKFNANQNANNNKNLLDISNEMMNNSDIGSTGNSKRSTGHKRASSSENRVKYGPILVRPRTKAAPTLATGRRSKDEMVRQGFENVSGCSVHLPNCYSFVCFLG
jgi:hypothetical protein